MFFGLLPAECREPFEQLVAYAGAKIASREPKSEADLLDEHKTLPYNAGLFVFFVNLSYLSSFCELVRFEQPSLSREPVDHPGRKGARKGECER